jgi:hypothetical protein
MISAKSLSEAIRKKRKSLKDGGVENMVDTAPGPQMNPQDVLELKERAHIDEVLDLPEKSEAPSDPADPELGDSQKAAALARAMKRVARILGHLKVG